MVLSEAPNERLDPGITEALGDDRKRQRRSGQEPPGLDHSALNEPQAVGTPGQPPQLRRQVPRLEMKPPCIRRMRSPGATACTSTLMALG